MEPVRQTREELSFGPFTLVPSERLLTRQGVAVPLGTRALDILIALVLRAGVAMEKRALIAQVWPDVTVSEGSLRFHIANLRKALGDGENSARYITTLAGRGYVFVAPISRPSEHPNTIAPTAANVIRSNMPNPLGRMVGRSDGVRTLSTRLATKRFVTIVGAGGVGKTTVAVAVANNLVSAFAGAVLFVDLGALRDPALAAASLAAMLGLSVRSDDPTPGVIAYLRDKRILLVLDNCEHLIEAAAILAARIFVAALQVHILATSREALRVEGEHVHRLEPLACPPDNPGLTARVALTYPAVQLFMERTAASGADLVLGDTDAAIVARICRRLDGVALAIELAAARVETFGLEQTAALLEERLALLWLGQRSAPPRQQTLKATLDWSYELLTSLERLVLRQLAVFVGDFALGAALAVLTRPSLDQMLVLGAIDNLVAKSMVAINRAGTTTRYRLLDTTRDYVLAIRIDEEFTDLAARHAGYYRQWLEQTEVEQPTSPIAPASTPQPADLGNVRSALEWCFGVDGNVEIGVALAAAATPVFLAKSLLTECYRWSERALHALDAAALGGRDEMRLQATLGMSLMFMRGESEAVPAALNRSLSIAEARGDALTQLKLLGPLRMFHSRIADFKVAVLYAKRASAVSRSVGDPTATTLAHSMLGGSLYFAGDLGGARMELEAALKGGPGSQRTRINYLGFGGHEIARVTLAMTLWLLGYPAQAVECAHQALEEAARINHPVTLSVVLIWGIYVFLWTGNLEGAERHIEWFISRAEAYSLGPYRAVGRGFQGQLAMLRGDAKVGVENLQACLVDLHAARYELLTTPFNISLVQGLVATGQFADGAFLIDETIRHAEANGEHCYMPELLRVKGNVLLSLPRPARDEAEACYRQSLDLSRRQAARSWELRTAISLAALLRARGQAAGAEELLRRVFEQFTEGLDSADLKAAERLLATFS